MPVFMSLCRVCMLSSLPVCLPVLRALRVLCSALNSYRSTCLLSSFSTILIDPYVTVHIDVRTTLLIFLLFFHLHLHFFNSCSCVSKHVYT